MAAAEDQQTEPKEVEIHGDVLEILLSHVPLVDLVSASRVSKSWDDAVCASLRHYNKPKPWLILHTQSTRCPYRITTCAYDPRSDVWMKLDRPSIEHPSAIKSSYSNFLYMLTPFQFSFSFDTFNLNWYHVGTPLVWRNDPIVARVGDYVIIGGGGCDFEDDPLAMEIYSLKTRKWHACESMPGSFRDSPASLWLSVATSIDKLIVTDKQSGLTHWFDPETRYWSDPILLDPGQPVSSYNIGCCNNRLILVGVIGTRNAERVKVWRVVGEDFRCEEIGEMPREFVEKLKSENSGKYSMNIRVSGTIVYVYNTSAVEEVVACELVDDGFCRWWSVRNAVARWELIANSLVYTCSEVGLDDLIGLVARGSNKIERILVR